MNKLKYYITGVVFLVIAIGSLYVMLTWSQPSSKTTKGELEGSTSVVVTPKGMPFIWAEETTSKTQIFSEPERNVTERQIKASKLLANIIVWGVGLGIIALVLRGLDGRFIK